MPAHKLPIAKRLDRPIRKTVSGCWEWTGARHAQGYGQLAIDGVVKRASRLQWERFNGPIPPSLCVLHRCDNPPCINPNHLFLGTRGDNARDCVGKGRWRDQVGELNNMSTLTDVQVLEIAADPRIHRLIATSYGVSRSTITNIKTGRRRSSATAQQE